MSPQTLKLQYFVGAAHHQLHSPRYLVSTLLRKYVTRQRYLEKFVSDVTEVADKIRPLQDRTFREAREAFVKKLYLSMKLALSKYRPIQVCVYHADP